MSKLRHRSQAARKMEQAASALGYSISRTTAGHLRFVHPLTGRIIIGPSGKQQGDISRKVYAELERYADTLDNV